MIIRSALSSLLSLCALAGPISPQDVPEPLRPWTSWVLRGRESALCPFLLGPSDAPRCAWPARLELSADDRSGQTTQRWQMHREEWVPLPGEAQRWPQEVSVDGRPAVVIAREEMPGVILDAGEHTVRARFLWETLPESLRVPPETGLIALTVRGAPVPFPLRDADGRIWLERAGEAEPEAEDRLDLLAHRLIVDEVPLRVTTRVALRVSGKDREVLLGKALMPDAIAMSLTGALPARLESDGRLRVQVRPGEHVLELVTRHQGPQASLRRVDPDGPWADSEVWAFEARNHLRVVKVEGVPSVDARQTTLPAEWHGFPAYLMTLSDTMRLSEKRRGDADPPPDRLVITRTLWLDHDGGGYTAQDFVTGTLRQSFRLEMGSGTDLGRVSVDGRDQLITRERELGPVGVEVRQGIANLESVSRVERRSSVPAVSWDHDFHEVSAQLRIPPGWRLLAAWGADRIPETWLMRWSLLDLFLVLVVAFAAGRLWGARWGVVALCAVGLTATEEDAPRWIWLAVLAGEALVRLLTTGRVARLVRLSRLAAWVALVLTLVPFVIGHLRTAIYPAVRTEPTALFDFTDEQAAEFLRAPTAEQMREATRAPAVRAQEAGGQPLMGLEGGAVGAVPAAPSAAEPPAKSEPEKQKLAAIADYVADVDPSAQVQTGPGLPRWTGDTATIQWSGPVKRAQTLRLLLAPPWFNLLLALLRVALLAILLVRVLGRLASPRGMSAAAIALLILFPMGARADFPPADLLEDLRARLLMRPDCAPYCASAPRMWVEALPNALRVRLEIDSAAATAVPLPGADEWPPQRVLLDGSPARALLRHEGALWIAVDPGRHQVLIEGDLPPRATVRIGLPPLLRPRRVEVDVSGWTVAGVHEDGVADDNLILTRVAGNDTPEAGGLEPTALPPFVSVERTLRLDLTWQVHTTVRRLTPSDSAVALGIPLVSGESVTTPEIRTEPGQVLLHLPPGVDEAMWQSSLPVTKSIALRAPNAVGWTEVWRLDASAVWHVAPRGIPPIQPLAESGRRVPEWRPWPGEKVDLAVSRPAGAPGPTLTLEAAEVVVRPGERATDTTLAMTLRSSRGGEHTVKLPSGAQLESVLIDGVPQPIRQQQRRVTIPIEPTEQRVALAWREPWGMGLRFSGSAIDMGAPGSNVALQIDMGQGRWTLVLGGPRQGPAVLFWSLLLGLLLVAWGLSRTPLCPLRFHQWMLLAVGLSQIPVGAAALVAGWFLAFGLRRRFPDAAPRWFNLRQLLLVAWTAVALGVLFAAIRQGLLGSPDMQIAGNGSTADHLRWFADRTGPVPPRPWVISVPLIVYRLAMLGWALWIAAALLRWLRWAWTCFCETGLWRNWRTPSSVSGPAAPRSP